MEEKITSAITGRSLAVKWRLTGGQVAVKWWFTNPEYFGTFIQKDEAKYQNNSKSFDGIQYFLNVVKYFDHAQICKFMR